MNHLPVIPKTVETPTGAVYEGVAFEGRICGVSILRAGEVLKDVTHWYTNTNALYRLWSQL